MKDRCALMFFLAAALVPAIARAQIDTERVPPGQDSSDLYRRAAASQIVVVGTVAASEGVSKRMTDQLIQRVKAEGDLSLALGGTLYTIHPEDILCRQADFKTEMAKPLATPQTLYMFMARDEPLFVDSHRKETLVVGQRYLLFLVAPPSHVLQNWISSFQLNPKYDYYRGEELSRGVVPLSQDANDPKLLERVTQLCGALKPTNLTDKLVALRKLSTSGDPVLREEAALAEAALKAQLPNRKWFCCAHP
jgi:hypothetical protein